MEYNQNDNYKKISEAWNEPYKVLPDAQINRSWKKMYDQVSSQPESPWSKYSWTGLVAAVFLIFFSCYFFLEVYNPTLHVTNLAQAQKEVHLPDGSLVLLQKGSELYYKEEFRDIRKVKLKGQAFFDVVKDSLMEFQVETRSTTTTVLGTSFTVRGSSDQDDAKVSLYTGQVVVAIKGMKDSFDLVPGESLVYEKGKVSIEDFKRNLSFSPGEKYLDVNNLKLEKVLDFIERRYQYQVERNPQLETKRVTLRINKSDSIDQIIRLLSIINSTDFEVNHKTKRVKVLSK